MRYIPDWAELCHGVAHTPDRDQEMIPVTRETLRICKSLLRKQNAEEAYHTIMAAEHEVISALEESVPDKIRMTSDVLKRLETYIKRVFKGKAVAVRHPQMPAWEGEPFMKMSDAELITHNAVVCFLREAK